MLIFLLINLSNDDFVPVTIVLNVLISPKLEKENFILKSMFNVRLIDSFECWCTPRTYLKDHIYTQIKIKKR